MAKFDSKTGREAGKRGAAARWAKEKAKRENPERRLTLGVSNYRGRSA